MSPPRFNRAFTTNPPYCVRLAKKAPLNMSSCLLYSGHVIRLKVQGGSLSLFKKLDRFYSSKALAGLDQYQRHHMLSGYLEILNYKGFDISLPLHFVSKNVLVEFPVQIMILSTLSSGRNIRSKVQVLWKPCPPKTCHGETLRLPLLNLALDLPHSCRRQQMEIRIQDSCRNY